MTESFDQKRAAIAAVMSYRWQALADLARDVRMSQAETRCHLEHLIAVHGLIESYGGPRDRRYRLAPVEAEVSREGREERGGKEKQKSRKTKRQEIRN